MIIVFLGSKNFSGSLPRWQQAVPGYGGNQNSTWQGTLSQYLGFYILILQFNPTHGERKHCFLCDCTIAFLLSLR